jgi:hypothetical protein
MDKEVMIFKMEIGCAGLKEEERHSEGKRTDVKNWNCWGA